MADVEIGDFEFLQQRAESRQYEPVTIAGRKFQCRSLTAGERIDIANRFEAEEKENEKPQTKEEISKRRSGLYAVLSLCGATSGELVFKDEPASIDLVMNLPAPDFDEIDQAVMKLSFKKADDLTKNSTAAGTPPT